MSDHTDVRSGPGVTKWAPLTPSPLTTFFYDHETDDDNDTHHFRKQTFLFFKFLFQGVSFYVRGERLSFP